MNLTPLSTLPDLFESLTTPVTRDTQERIDTLWERERAKGGLLFDGFVLSQVERRGSRWVCAYVPYRHWVAQRRSEPLGALLEVQPVAVAAVLRCRDGLVVGRRSDQLHQEPGRWELAPSGTIDPRARVGARRVSAQAQLFLELEEELGVRGIDVRVMRPFALAESAAQRTSELVFDVEVSLSFARLRAACAALGRGEYSELRCLSIDGLEQGIESLDPPLPPLSRRLLAAHGWIQGTGFNEDAPSAAASRAESMSRRGGEGPPAGGGVRVRRPDESSAHSPR